MNVKINASEALLKLVFKIKLHILALNIGYLIVQGSAKTFRRQLECRIHCYISLEINTPEFRLFIIVLYRHYI